MTSDYRRRIYGRYRDTHIQALRPPTPADFAYDAKAFSRIWRKLLPRDRSAAIFEVGCGCGSFLHFLGAEGYSRAEGMEQDPAQVETARRLGVASAAAGDAFEHLRSRPGAYDCVVAIDVLEHLRKDELFGHLDLVAGALKPGGVFLWRAPNAGALFSGRLRYGDLTHELSFTRSSAWQLMAAAGFSDIRVLGEAPVVTGARSLLRAALWSCFELGARLYLYAESCAFGDCLLTPNLIVRAVRSSSCAAS